MLIQALLKVAEDFPTHPMVTHPLTPTFRAFLAQYQDNNPHFPPPGFRPDIEFLDDLWELYQRYVLVKLGINQLALAI